MLYRTTFLSTQIEKPAPTTQKSDAAAPNPVATKPAPQADSKPLRWRQVVFQTVPPGEILPNSYKRRRKVENEGDPETQDSNCTDRPLTELRDPSSPHRSDPTLRAPKRARFNLSESGPEQSVQPLQDRTSSLLGVSGDQRSEVEMENGGRIILARLVTSVIAGLGLGVEASAAVIESPILLLQTAWTAERESSMVLRSVEFIRYLFEATLDQDPRQLIEVSKGLCMVCQQKPEWLEFEIISEIVQILLDRSSTELDQSPGIVSGPVSGAPAISAKLWIALGYLVFQLADTSDATALNEILLHLKPEQQTDVGAVCDLIGEYLTARHFD